MKAMSNETVLGRRNFLARAIQLAAVTSPFLSACGGGGSGDDDESVVLPADAIMLTGRVVVPAGLSLSGAHVVTPLADVAVSATGGFQARFKASNFGVSQVQDASGNLLLFGFLGGDRTTLSARSTAEALVYQELGLWAHAPRVRVAALTLLAAEDLSSVEAAVVSATGAGGATWAKAGMAGVASAVRGKASALMGPRSAVASQRVSAQGMIVSPTDRVSGLIVEGDGIGACTVTNYFRRRSMLASTAYAAKLETGMEFALPENFVKTDIAPIDGLSSPLQAINDIFGEHKSVYTPLAVNLPTPLVPAGSVYTRYRVYGVGPGLSRGVWDDLPESVREAGRQLIFKSVILDFIMPALASVVVYVAAEDIDKLTKVSETADALKDLINGLAKTPDLVDYLTRGDLSGCIKATWAYIKGSDSWQIFLTAIIGAVLELELGAYVVDPETSHETHFADYTNKTWAKFDKFFDFGEFAFTLFDSAIQAYDIGSSRWAESWEVTVTKAKVSLMPRVQFTEKNTQLAGLTATVADASMVEGKVFGYTWKARSGRVYVDGKYGKVIDSTTFNVVAYDAFDVPAGTLDQVEVDVFLSGFGKDDPVGSAKTLVYVTGVTVTPEQKTKLKANETVTLTAATVGMRPLAAGEKVVYKWKLGGTAGTLTATDTATATFKADATKQGLAAITVEAFLGEQRIGIATSNLTVGDQLVIAGRLFEVHFKDENCHTGMYIAVPKVEGAKRYTVHVSGMRGPVFGTDYTWYIFVNPDGTSNWQTLGSEWTTGIGGGGGGGADCVDAPDGRWAAWYQGSTVEAIVQI